MTRILAGLALALFLIAGFQSWRLDRVKGELATANEALAKWEGYEERSSDAATVAAESCTARVAEARRSTQRIETVIERPYAVDPQGCPVRAVIGADELRDALQPAPSKP